MDLQSLSRKIILVAAFIVSFTATYSQKSNSRYELVTALFQGIPVEDSFTSWVHYLDTSTLITFDSLTANYLVHGHIDAGKKKYFFEKDSELQITESKVTYDNRYTQELVTAIVFFNDNKEGEVAWQNMYDSLKKLLNVVFQKFDESAHPSPTKNRKLTFAFDNSRNELVYVHKVYSPELNKYYIRLNYRRTIYLIYQHKKQKRTS